MEPPDDRIPNGVPIQTMVYISSKKILEGSGDPCEIQIIDSQKINIFQSQYAKDKEKQSNVYEFEHVFDNSSEHEVYERQLSSIVNTCIEGVDSCFMSIGSSTTIRTDITEGSNENEQNYEGLMRITLQELYEQLENKARNTDIENYNYYTRISYVEFYEETINDLLNPTDKHIYVNENLPFGVNLVNATRFGPLKNVSDAIKLLNNGRQSKNTSKNQFGDISNYVTACLKIDLKQTASTNDKDASITISSIVVVNLASTEKLLKGSSTTNITEGPLLNKALFAFEAVCKHFAANKSSVKQKTMNLPPYDDSQLTKYIKNCLGGNCITTVLFFLSENDYSGCKATLSLLDKIKCINNYPMINNEITRGLWYKYFTEIILLRDEVASSKNLGNKISKNATSEAEMLSTIHNLEGKVILENMEKLRLKDDKEKLYKTITEYKAKYQQVIQSKESLLQTSIELEEEKLRISKALLDLQLENSTLREKAEQEKFEIVTKLLNAENDILELEKQLDDKIQTCKKLEEKLTELLEEKKSLATEFVALKSNYVNINEVYQKECSKTQEMGIELLNLVNQKNALTKISAEYENYKTECNEQTRKLKEQHLQDEKLLKLNCEKLSEYEKIIEELRSVKTKLELELQSLKVNFESKILRNDKNNIDICKNKEEEIIVLRKTIDDNIKKIHDAEKAQIFAIQELDTEKRKFHRQQTVWEKELERKSVDLEETMRANILLSGQLESIQGSFIDKISSFLDLKADSLKNTVPSGLKIEAADNSIEQVPSNSQVIQNAKQQALALLLENYKTKEKEFNAMEEKLKKENKELLKKNRLLYDKFKEIRFVAEDNKILKDSDGIDLPKESELKALNSSAIEDDKIQEIDTLRKRVQSLQAEISATYEKGLASADSYKSMVLDLENKCTKLNDTVTRISIEKEKIQYELDITKSHLENKNAGFDMKAMKEIQDTLLRQLQDIKAATTTHSRYNNKSEDERLQNMVTSLQLENNSLKDKLANSKNSTVQTTEEAERRCAELLTKNVLLQQELDSFKEHMKTQTSILQRRIQELRSQLDDAKKKNLSNDTN